MKRVKRDRQGCIGGRDAAGRKLIARGNSRRISCPAVKADIALINNACLRPSG